jgi:hypothetical protein
MPLTDLHRDVLIFERDWWRYLGAKEAEVRRRFGHSLVRHNQIVSWVIDQPEALEVDPVTVNRLRRLRATRARAAHRDAPSRRHASDRPHAGSDPA